MYKGYKIILTLFALIFSVMAIAQNGSAEEDGVMRSAGKIYVVLAIVLTILLGLLFYIIRLDRKISKLEKGNV